MFCGYEAVFGTFAKYSNEGYDRDSECNLPQNPLTQQALVCCTFCNTTDIWKSATKAFASCPGW